MAIAKNKDAPPILLIGTLDTKGEEMQFLRERLRSAFEMQSLLVDVGILGEPQCEADVTRDEIACFGGTSQAELAKAADRGNAIVAMQRGLCAWMREQSPSSFAGVLAIGGSAGTSIASAGMRELPIGLPKVLVSTMASGDVRPYVGTSDITMMYSVGDFTGLNRLTKQILGNAAGAIAGMAYGHKVASASDTVSSKTLVGATMFGVTTTCVRAVQDILTAEGFELLVFHATGTGGQAMERLIKDGFIEAVVDLTTTELADELVGGVLTAGPQRMEAAAQMGIPQVVSVGALDMVNFGTPESVPSRFSKRLFYPHNPAVTLMRTTVEENAELGRTLARKLNAATGSVKLLLPLRGVSALDAPGKAFFDPEADAALFQAIRENLAPHVALLELDLHINDPAFARAVADAFSAAVKEHNQHKTELYSAGESL
jgi:uncharacterized protein (UPF0261 family)